MNGYLLSIIGTVLLSSVLTALLPTGKTANVIKGITKLACVIAIIAPIPAFLKEGRFFDSDSEKNTLMGDKNLSQSVIQTDTSFIKYYCEMRIQNTELALQAELKEKFSLQAAVNCDWRFEEEDILDTDTVMITKITVKTENQLKEEEKQSVWEYLTKNYCREVLIE